MMIFLVEDSLLIRERLCAMIGEINSDIEIVEEETPLAAIAGILGKRPELVILDLNLDGGSGLDVLKEVKKSLPATRVIVLTNHADSLYRKKCMDDGAEFFFDKADGFKAVREIVRQSNDSLPNGHETKEIIK